MHSGPQRSESNERFVAFTFAASDIVVETDDAGRIAFATGAFPSRFGRPAATFLGTDVLEMVAPHDRQAARAALLAAVGQGRAPPVAVRLADTGHSMRTLAGLALPGTKPPRLCFTFSPLPEPSPAVPRSSATDLSRTLLLEPAGSAVHLVEVQSDADHARVCNVMTTMLKRKFPQVAVTELAPGRFSMAGGGLTGLAPGALSASLLDSLSAEKIAAHVTDHGLDLAREGLTEVQVALTLRRAFDVFARKGLAGLGASGLAEGLAAYVRKAEMQTVALRRSIKDHKFTMAYQPVSTLDSGKTHHLEALIRPAPHESYANPQEFVLLVETLNLATLLDFEVAEVVCEAALTASAPIAFNVSACSLSDEQFGQRLLTRLRRSPAAQKGRILIEMTETAVMPDQKQVQAIVDELRTLAVPFCIDDFGAGNADVQLLRSLPADYIKLDGSYVRDVATDERSRALANGLVEIASRSGAKMIAEWVETEAQRIALQAMGVTLGQGWLFGKPGPLVSEQRRSVARRQGAREQWG